MTSNFNRKLPFLGISEKIAQELSNTTKNIYENVYYYEISNCFPKDYARKSILMDKFGKKLRFLPPFWRYDD